MWKFHSFFGLILNGKPLELNRYTFFYSLITLLILSGCKVYKQDIMFRTEEGAGLSSQVASIERDYIIKVDDRLSVNLFANGGEQLIDPNFESVTNSSNNNQIQQLRERTFYLIQVDGTIKLPQIGDVEVRGLTLDQAEEIIEERYKEFYKNPFVKLQFLNKRVVVLGQQNMVVPLENQNTNLLEVISLAGGIPIGSKAQQVKIIRGDLQNPKIYVVDLSTIDGMKSSIMDVEDGDVIYIEPWRRTWQEGVRDISPIVGLTSSLTTLVFLFITISQ